MIRRALGVLVLQACFVVAARATCFTVGDPPEEICAEVYPATNPVSVELGQSIVIPMSYDNRTGRPITFQTQVEGNGAGTRIRARSLERGTSGEPDRDG